MKNKRKYILDENCLMHAANFEDWQGNESTTALRMITVIEDNCHGILVSNELKEKYLKNTIPKITKNRYPAANAVTVLIRNIMPAKNKFNYWNYKIYPLPVSEDEIPPEDLYLVRLAHCSKETLVTWDLDLIKALNPDENGLSEKYNIRVLNPEQVIAELTKPDDNS